MAKKKKTKSVDYDALVDGATPVCIHFLDHVSDDSWVDLERCVLDLESCRLYGVIYEHDEVKIKVACMMGDNVDAGITMAVIKSTISRIDILGAVETHGEA